MDGHPIFLSGGCLRSWYLPLLKYGMPIHYDTIFHSHSSLELSYFCILSMGFINKHIIVSSHMLSMQLIGERTFHYAWQLMGGVLARTNEISCCNAKLCH